MYKYTYLLTALTRLVHVVAGTAAAAPPATYPLGGYVNMNQLAHMAVMTWLVHVVAGTAAAVPTTTYPLGGYVNMNQLAHMALQHQGLCPADDKKNCEDLAHEQHPQPGGHQREDVGQPRAPRPNQHLVDNPGIGMFCYDCVSELGLWVRKFPLENFWKFISIFPEIYGKFPTYTNLPDNYICLHLHFLSAFITQHL